MTSVPSPRRLPLQLEARISRWSTSVSESCKDQMLRDFLRSIECWEQTMMSEFCHPFVMKWVEALLMRRSLIDMTGIEKRGGQVQCITVDNTATASVSSDPEGADRASKGLQHHPGRCLHHRLEFRTRIRRRSRGQTGSPTRGSESCIHRWTSCSGTAAEDRPGWRRSWSC